MKNNNRVSNAIAGMSQPFFTKNGRIEVREGASAFWITDTVTGQEASMGDCVDMFSTEDGASLYVGSKEFYSAMRRMVRTDKATLLEAYFGQ